MEQQIKDIKRAVALGDFDGVHLGHQKVLSSAVKTGLSPVALVIHCPFTILTQRGMTEVISQMGVKPIFMDFKRIAGMDGGSFVKQVLKEELNAGAVCCGYNFRFGKGAKWDAGDLKRFCEDEGIRFYKTPELTAADGGTISSTRIRKAISEGDMGLVRQLTGRPYSYRLTVSKGDQRGRTIGFPTINQKLCPSLTPPRFGVYASETLVNDRWYHSITNIGIRPTYQLDAPQSETHVIGFAGDLYGCEITVVLKKHLRDEKKFDSLAALKAQISEDIKRSIHNG